MVRVIGFHKVGQSVVHTVCLYNIIWKYGICCICLWYKEGIMYNTEEDKTKEELMKIALGDKYDTAMELRYDLIALDCGLVEMSNNRNMFISKTTGNHYMLTKHGFRKVDAEPIRIKWIKPSTKGWWMEFFGLKKKS